MGNDRTGMCTSDVPSETSFHGAVSGKLKMHAGPINYDLSGKTPRPNRIFYDSVFISRR